MEKLEHAVSINALEGVLSVTPLIEANVSRGDRFAHWCSASATVFLHIMYEGHVLKGHHDSSRIGRSLNRKVWVVLLMPTQVVIC